MKIIVVGCGKIGSAIISTLCREGHDIVAIDQNPKLVNNITNVYDVMGICGNGADSDILLEASVKDAELFVAVTGSDEVNMLSCFSAKHLGAKHTIARIRNPEYNDKSLGFFKQNLELSMSINPDYLAAKELFNVLKFPSAVKIETFSRGSLEMLEFRLKPDSCLDGMTLIEMREKHKAKVLVCYVHRDDKIFIPDGNFKLKSGDTIGITAMQTEVAKLFRSLGSFKKQAKNVMIMGGSRTAFYLAEMLLKIGSSVKIIEKDLAVCERLSEELPKAVIINGDGTDQELLVEEGIKNLDAFVALTGMDEQNILISIFSSSQNVPNIISKVNRTELIMLAQNLGLDCIVTPSQIIADITISYARALQNSLGSNIETLYRIADGKAEVLEFNVKSDSRVVNIPLKDLRCKQGILIAGIIRGQKTVIPAGNDMILAGDRVVIIAAEHRLEDLDGILD